jgi:hypothetical protein
VIPLDGFAARDLEAVDILPDDVGGEASGIVTAMYADRGLIYSDNSFYTARLVGDVVIAQTAIDLLGMGGRIGITAAEIELFNGDRAMDGIAADGRATGRAARIKTVAAPTPSRSDAGGVLANAATAFAGIVGGLTPNGRYMRLGLADFSQKLNTPLQTNFYDGTGGTGGSADLKGKPKPISFGWRYNISPQYLGLVNFGDGAKETYQSHWRQIDGHEAVRERGVAMSQTTSAPGVGQWKDWPSQGCFQLGFTANGGITCDVRGDATGGYVASTVEVIKRVLSSLGPLFSASDFDTDSLAVAGTQILGEMGWGAGTEVVSAAQAIDDLAGHSGLWVIGNRAGKFRMALPQPLAGATNFSLDDGDIVSLKPVQLPAQLQPAPSTIALTAAKNWTPLTDISSSVTGATRSALAGSGVTVSRTSSILTGRQSALRTMSVDSLFRYETDALRAVQRLQGWLEGGLRAFEVVTEKYLGQVELGHVGRITYPLFGLANGFSGVVAGWEETQGARRLKLTVVG